MYNLFNLSDQTWQLLDQSGILAGNFFMLASLLGAVYGFINRNDLRHWLVRNRFPRIGGELHNRHWQGLIFTVSRAEVPLWVIDQIQPLWVGLLVTQFSAASGEQIKRSLQRQNRQVMLRYIDNPDDPKEVYGQTRLLIQSLQQHNLDKIAIDITGGKAPMSLGAFMAAEELGADSIYVSTEQQAGKIDMSSAKIIAIAQRS
jgi:hypothetical protein